MIKIDKSENTLRSDQLARASAILKRFGVIYDRCRLAYLNGEWRVKMDEEIGTRIANVWEREYVVMTELSCKTLSNVSIVSKKNEKCANFFRKR